MIRPLLFSCVMLAAGASDAAAHHTTPGKAHRMAAVRISEPVLADGKPLAPGTYEVIVTDERPVVAEGATPSENQRWVEFVQNRQIVGREIAEVFAAGDRPVGTSGSSSPSVVVQRLRGNEFVRIAVSDDGGRYLIHLPTGRGASEP